MNILFITNKFITGGAERYILKKASALTAEGHKALIISAGGEYTTRLLDLNIPFVNIPGLDKNINLLSHSEILLITAKVGAAIHSHDIDIVEIDSPVVLEVGIAAAFACKIPFLLNVFHEYSFGSRRDTRLLEVLSRSGLLFFLSESIGDIISSRTGADLKGARVLPIVLDPDEFSNDVLPLEISDDLFVFVAIARLTKDKAYIDVLMDEYCQFVNRAGAKKTRLFIVGDGPLFNRYHRKSQLINKRIRKNDNLIIMMGNRTDISAFYRRADVYVGMGTTALEAAFFKTPVIVASFYPYHTASIGYFSRIAYESVGEVVPSRVSFVSYSDMMSELYKDEKLRENLADSGYQKICDMYLTEIVMKKWIVAYNDLILEKQLILSLDIDDMIYLRDNKRLRAKKVLQSLSRLAAHP